MKQFKININDLFEKSEVETMMDDVEKSAIIYEMNNINQKVLNEISTYANNRERIQNLTDEFTNIMYHDRISNNDVERIDYICFTVKNSSKIFTVKEDVISNNKVKAIVWIWNPFAVEYLKIKSSILNI